MYLQDEYIQIEVGRRAKLRERSPPEEKEKDATDPLFVCI